MQTDRDFLATIDTRPDDRAFRLIYADWLEERSDPRGELIRVEEEMRQLPVYSDPFWALKPRRNELRSQTDADWLARMRYGTECEPVFRHGVPDGWRDRWRLIRELTERWHRKPMPDVGGHQDAIRAAGQRLGRALPPSIREYIAYACDLEVSGQPSIVHRDEYMMEGMFGQPALSLLLQAEGDHHWAVLYDDLHHTDPPVHGYHWDHERENQAFVPSDWFPETGSVTEFIFRYTLAYLRGRGGGFRVEVSDLVRLVRDLTASFPVHTRFGMIHVYEADNLLIHLQQCPDRYCLQVELFKPMPREAVPAFLSEYTRNGGSFHGMFVP
jgi:uncharacterized protein (TIGR02996 family)